MDSKFTRVEKTASDYTRAGAVTSGPVAHAPNFDALQRELCRALIPEGATPEERARNVIDQIRALRDGLVDDGGADEALAIEAQVRAGRPAPVTIPTEAERMEVARAILDGLKEAKAMERGQQQVAQIKKE